MRRKLIALLLLMAVAASVTLFIAGAKPNGVKPLVNAAPVAHKQQPPADEPGMVDGAKHPELIPDRVAYSLLFRVISGRRDAQAKARIRSYIRQFGTGVKGCAESDCSKRMGDSDVDALLAAADEFQQRVGALDQQAGEIKKNHWATRTPETMAQLAQLQRQKDAILAEIIASLPRRLSAGGLNRLRAHVEGRVKPRTKIRKPSAEMPDAQLGSIG